MKIATVVGARPQFVKAAVVSQALRDAPNLVEVLIHTGQHYDNNMSAVFFEELDIPEPAYNLGIGSGSHGLQTGRQLIAIEEILMKEKPDWVLVYGDTNSTLAGALAAAKLNIPLAHVEAGLRSFNRTMPEEVNRVLTDHCSTLLFAPTPLARLNLEREGVAGSNVHLVGDVMFDATLRFSERAAKKSNVLEKLGVMPDRYILTTIHRAANTDNLERLERILEGIFCVAGDMSVVFPVHPRTRGAIIRAGYGEASVGGNLKLVAPVGYLDMLMLEKHAAVIVTDSGGVQKEAFFCGVPCVTLREETEWRELVAAGWNRLCPPTNAEAIQSAITNAIGTKGETLDAYGNGNAAKLIAGVLTNS